MKRIKDIGLKEITEKLTELYKKYGDVAVGLDDTNGNEFKIINVYENTCPDDIDIYNVCIEISRGYAEYPEE